MVSPVLQDSAVFAPWAGWRPATCLPDRCFCEAIHAGIIRQPANTWSSLAFVLAAFWVARTVIRSPRERRPALGPAEGWLLVASLVIVGLGSAFYHASLTFVGQVIDVSGMYLIATFMLLHRLGPRWGLPPVGSVLVFVVVNAGLMTAQVTTPSLRRVVFAGLLLAAIAVGWSSSRGGRRWLGLGALTMSAAFAIWVLDLFRIVCAPESVFQGHAVWHLLGALAAICLFRSYEADPN